MDYIELNIPVKDNEQAEILVAMLADFPFDSFAEEGSVLKAYIPKDHLPDYKNDIDDILKELGIAGQAYIEIEAQNWNELWESNFQPVHIEGICTIRAPFSEPPAEGQDIVIMPKMSFGTGHHATTYLMAAEIMHRDYTGKEGLDMGSGTGVLAIIAVKRGASHVDAVDIDEWAFENCVENIEVNGTSAQITPVLGNADAIKGKHYDFILANINRNILLADMPRYTASLNKGGELLMSGILERDIPAITEKAEQEGLTVVAAKVKDGWALVECLK